MISANKYTQTIGLAISRVALVLQIVALEFYLQQIISEQIDYLQQSATMCNNLQQIFYKLKLISNKCHAIICNNRNNLQISATIFSFLFQSNFTTNCHLYLPPVSSFLTLFRSKLNASSMSL